MVLYRILLHIIIGMFLGIYMHYNIYATIGAILILYAAKNIKIPLLIGAVLGYICLLKPTHITQSGIVTYIGKDCIFLENHGCYQVKSPSLRLKDKITFTSYNNKITKIYDRASATPMFPFIIKHREYIRNFLKNNRHYDFWLAIILGDKSYIKNSDLRNLLDSNIYHLIVISGFHLTLIYYFVYNMVSSITQRSKTINYYCTIYASYDIIPHTIACGVCIYYFLLCLSGLSFLRALLMLLLKKSTYSSKLVLLTLMFFCILYNPLLIFNKGFLLSYVVTFLLLEKQSNSRIAIFTSTITGALNPLTLVNNAIGTAIIYILLPVGFLGILINHICILNAFDSLIEIFINHLPTLNLYIHQVPKPLILIIALLNILYVQNLKITYLYMAFAIVLISQVIM